MIMESKLAVVTTVTSDYLYRSIALERRLKLLVPQAELIVVCVDNEPSITKAKNIVFGDHLRLPRYGQMLRSVTPSGMCCMLKPHAVSYALSEMNFDRVIYLDNDIYVYNNLDALIEALGHHDLVITPHLLEPKGISHTPTESHLQAYGTYNAGIFGVRKSKPAMEFLRWWGNWLLDPRHLNESSGYDQCWLNFAPAFCETTHVFRDVGYNVAYWNLSERDLKLTDNGFFCKGKPLVTFHFSCFDPSSPSQLMKCQSFCNYRPSKEFEVLGNTIVKLWIESGFDPNSQRLYAFHCWEDGSEVTIEQRNWISANWDHLDESMEISLTKLRELMRASSQPLNPRCKFKLQNGLRFIKKKLRDSFLDTFGARS